MFVLMNLDNWNSVMFDTIDAQENPDLPPHLDYNYWNALYIIFFVVGVGVILMNMFVGVVVQTFTNRLSENEGYGLLTPEQRKWVHSQKVLQTVLPRSALSPPTNKGVFGLIRRWCFRLAYIPLSFEKLEHRHYGKSFEYFILGTIAFNAVMMAFRPYPKVGVHIVVSFQQYVHSSSFSRASPLSALSLQCTCIARLPSCSLHVGSAALGGEPRTRDILFYNWSLF